MRRNRSRDGVFILFFFFFDVAGVVCLLLQQGPSVCVSRRFALASHAAAKMTSKASLEYVAYLYLVFRRSFVPSV